ncbi:MAG: acyltransferase family protein [Rhodospirillales bacterium]|nr:acyltransferase family protein [Rhodospirillales bacterium]
MRLAFVDNIRWTMILLVLSMHASDTYSPFGSWYYTDRGEPGFGTVLAFGLYQTFLQAFFMALLFFIAGYFAAPAFDRKGLVRFSRDRLLRLGVPTLLYMLVIGPLTQYFLSRTWGTGGFAHQWLIHLRDGEWLSETGPMWFCAFLLALSLAYALLRQAWPELTRRQSAGRTAGLSPASSPAWRWRHSWCASPCPRPSRSSTCTLVIFRSTS